MVTAPDPCWLRHTPSHHSSLLSFPRSSLLTFPQCSLSLSILHYCFALYSSPLYWTVLFNTVLLTTAARTLWKPGPCSLLFDSPTRLWITEETPWERAWHRRGRIITGRSRRGAT